MNLGKQTKKLRFVINKILHNNIIMNWSNLNKCILILSLACTMHLLWLFWKIFILLTPSLWHWVDMSLLKFQIYLNLASFFLLLFLILPCWLFQGKQWAETALPYAILNIFVAVIMRDGYLIGLFSPATVIAFICISGLGLILFEHRFVYFPLIFACIVYIILSYLTLTHALPYSPLFTPELLSPTLNIFWVSSMAYFVIPIAFASLILCEILLFQWRHRESLIKTLSQTDPLTTLFNRRHFNEQLKRVQAVAHNYAIILLDLDHFKTINDQYGHSVGDNALKQVAQCLKSHLPEQDLVARFGGEEFIFSLQNITLEQTHAIAEHCRLAISYLRIPVSADKFISLTASFGLAMSNPTQCIDSVIHSADKALYIAKQKGRNQVHIYQS